MGGDTMKNSEQCIKNQCYEAIEVLLKTVKNSEELTKQLRELKEKYLKNIVN